MMTELTTETELRFNVKTVSVEDRTNMLEKRRLEARINALCRKQDLS
jgi:hypothetical protein